MCKIEFGIQEDENRNAILDPNGIHICHACGIGEKQTEIANNACGQCPAGTNNNDDANTCICNLGHEGQANDENCEACALGFYKSEQGIGNCTGCPGQNLTTELTGTILRDNCTCPAGFGFVGDDLDDEDAACSPCAHGTYKGSLGRDSAQPVWRIPRRFNSEPADFRLRVYARLHAQ